MTFDKICQRADLLGTQVITRNRGKRLGVVSQLWVDIDRREVVAIGMRDNILAIAGMPKFMYLTNIREIGDVILVDDDNVVEDDIDVEIYSNLINSEVITETGELLGRVRGFKFNTETGQLTSLIIASIGLPQIPEQLLSTYELPIEEIVSSGPNRLIVFEGSEERLQQLSVGVLERLGLGEPPWQREEEGIYYPPTVKPENQIGTGITTAAPQTVRATTPAPQEWDEDWEEPAPPPPVRQVEPQPVYDQYEEDNWGDAGRDDYYDDDYYQEPPPKRYEQAVYEDEYAAEGAGEHDAWGDDEAPKPYKPTRLNIPEKQRAPEYEEETGY